LAQGRLLADPTRYRRLIRRLIYLTITTLGRNHAVHILCQFMQALREGHMGHILRYLKGTAGQDILLGADSRFQLAGFCENIPFHKNLSLGTLSCWVANLFYGVARSRLLYLDLQPKQNNNPWHLQQVNWYGYDLSKRPWAFSLLQWNFLVIVKQHFILHEILCSMKEWNISRLIVTFFGKSMKLESLPLLTLGLSNNHWISLLKLLERDNFYVICSFFFNVLAWDKCQSMLVSLQHWIDGW